MQHQIMEGEPGIFPDPVARILRAIGGVFNRGRTPSRDDDGGTDESADESTGDDQTTKKVIDPPA